MHKSILYSNKKLFPSLTPNSRRNLRPAPYRARRPYKSKKALGWFPESLRRRRELIVPIVSSLRLETRIWIYFADGAMRVRRRHPIAEGLPVIQ
jgi:hypothetical protein